MQTAALQLAMDVVDRCEGATSAQEEPRRVLLTVHTGRGDIVDLARTSAARLTAAGSRKRSRRGKRL